MMRAASGPFIVTFNSPIEILSGRKAEKKDHNIVHEDEVDLSAGIQLIPQHLQGGQAVVRHERNRSREGAFLLRVNQPLHHLHIHRRIILQQRERTNRSQWFRNENSSSNHNEQPYRTGKGITTTGFPICHILKHRIVYKEYKCIIIKRMERGKSNEIYREVSCSPRVAQNCERWAPDCVRRWAWRTQRPPPARRLVERVVSSERRTGLFEKGSRLSCGLWVPERACGGRAVEEPAAARSRTPSCRAAARSKKWIRSPFPPKSLPCDPDQKHLTNSL